MPLNENNILHITDLHFGDNRQTESGEIITKLFEHLKTEFKDTNDFQAWKPDWIAVSGDIAFDGEKTSNYSEAAKFFVELGEVLNVGRERFIFCPGNHDVIQENIYNNYFKLIL